MVLRPPSGLGSPSGTRTCGAPTSSGPGYGRQLRGERAEVLKGRGSSGQLLEQASPPGCLCHLEYQPSGTFSTHVKCCAHPRSSRNMQPSTSTCSCLELREPFGQSSSGSPGTQAEPNRPHHLLSHSEPSSTHSTSSAALGSLRPTQQQRRPQFTSLLPKVRYRQNCLYAGLPCSVLLACLEVAFLHLPLSTVGPLCPGMLPQPPPPASPSPPVFCPGEDHSPGSDVFKPDSRQRRHSLCWETDVSAAMIRPKREGSASRGSALPRITIPSCRETAKLQGAEPRQ